MNQFHPEVSQRLKKGDKIGIVCCSNGLEPEKKQQVEELLITLPELGLTPVLSPYLYARGDDVRSASAKERAEVLMGFYRDKEVKAVFDISGGDVAVEILPYLDFDVIADSAITFWGYSDLTTIINAIYAKTGKVSCLYQLRNLVRSRGAEQKERFLDYLQGGNNLCTFSYEYLQGEGMQGTLVGGNARCLLKLAGSDFFPDMTGKILFLEGLSGGVGPLVSFFSQLRIQGVFEQVGGILLGTFTEMEKKKLLPSAFEILKEMIPDPLPVAVTKEIGHGAGSRCLILGSDVHLA
ncbi:MAG: LD-carboxypeptidase [Lachnospiraceae bacterium]|nr:LD-carboxypeptidase [Lachnospiraceae bacterium]